MPVVEIVVVPKIKVAKLSHTSGVNTLHEAIAKMMMFRKSAGFSPSDKHRTYALFHNEPNSTDHSQHIELAVSIDQLPGDFEKWDVFEDIIPSGRYARAQYQGPREEIPLARWLVQEWLPQSGFEHTGEPIIFQFLNQSPDTPSNLLLTDIYLPLLS